MTKLECWPLVMIRQTLDRGESLSNEQGAFLLQEFENLQEEFNELEQEKYDLEGDKEVADDLRSELDELEEKKKEDDAWYEQEIKRLERELNKKD
jgi:hypothetical protein